MSANFIRVCCKNRDVLFILCQTLIFHRRIGDMFNLQESIVTNIVEKFKNEDGIETLLQCGENCTRNKKKLSIEYFDINCSISHRMCKKCHKQLDMSISKVITVVEFLL